LIKHFSHENDDEKIREGSLALRRLLVDRNLQQAASQLDCSLQISVPDNYPRADHPAFKNCDMWYGGTAQNKGMTVAGMVFSTDLKSENPPIPNPEGAKRKIKLNAYLSLPSIASNGIVCTNEDVIKYIANKRGGVHFDSTRKGKRKDKNLAMDASGVFQIAEKESVFLCLLGIGQKIRTNTGIKKLRSKIAPLLAMRITVL